MGKILKCSVLHEREIEIPNCKDDPEYCTRTYHLFLPNILCSGKVRERYLENNVVSYGTAHMNGSIEGEYHNVGIIPMVYALHGLGNDYKTMSGFVQGAEDYNFALVIPVGINESFNAKSCCGDAKTLGIHDDDFIYYIQQQLSEQFSFLKAEYSYGIGWDNGALLLTEALISYPKLFRAIASVSGPTLSARNWIPTNIGSGIPLMLHYSLDDLTIRPSGCCDDSDMPTCQSEFKADSCVSFLQSFDLWAKGVNLCAGGTNDEALETTDPATVLVGGEGEFLYSLLQKDGKTSMELIAALNEDGENKSTMLWSSELRMTITRQRKEYVCMETISSSCVSTSVLCVYKSMGHFNGFISTPFMSNHVMEFLARDACGINDGLWAELKNQNKNVCGCVANGFEGVFCLDKMTDDVVVDVTNSISAEPSQSVGKSPSASSPLVFSSNYTSPMQLPHWCMNLMAFLLVTAAAVAFTISWRKYRSRSSGLRGDSSFNPYRDQFKVKVEGSEDRKHQNADPEVLSLPDVRLNVHTTLRRNSTLEPDDIELLQLYRQKSVNSMPESDNLRNFNEEFPHSYELHAADGDASASISNYTRRHIFNEDYLFDSHHHGEDIKRITSRHSDEVIKNIWWDD